MKQDPLNEFLKQHADSYKVRPSAHAFEGLMGRRAAGLRRRRRAIWLSLSIMLLGVVSFLVGKEYGQSEREQMQESSAQLQQMPGEKIPETSPLSEGRGAGGAAKETKAGSINQRGQPLSQKAIKENPIHEAQANPVAAPQKFVRPARPKPAHHVSRDNTPAPKSEVRNRLTKNDEKLPPANISKEEKIMLPESPLITKSSDEPVAKEEEEVKAANYRPDTSVALATDTIRNNLPKLPVFPARTYKWSISAVYSGQLLSELYSMNSEADLLWLNTQFKESDRKGKSRKAFTTGLKLERNFGKHFGLSAGMTYTKIFFQEMPFFVTKKTPPYGYTVSNPNAVKTFAVSAPKVSYSYDESLTYLDAPLMLYYRQHHRKMIYYAGAGLSCSYLLHTRTIVFDSTTAVKVDDAKGERWNRLLLATNFSAGIGYQILPRWSIYAGPVARMGLNGIYDKAYCARKSNFMMNVEGGLKFLF